MRPSASNRKSFIITALVLLAVSFLPFIISCKFYFNTTKDSFTATSSNASLERGKNLAFNICAGCHYDPTLKKFIGRSLNDLPKIAGHLYSANLTQSKTNGIPPNYSDAELFYLLRTGIARSGKFMPNIWRPPLVA